ncbi:MAG: methionyl-tRNA formyltransferase [Acidobacteria bacterium]|nr:MAG: methionyl-tRNA formyltransferase [Acidobacteriota bacterium]
MRIVFLGTPEFAVPTLDALAAAHEIALVVAQPDKRAGRGLQLQSPAIARRAKELGLPLAQPAKIRDALPQIEALKPDLGIIVAYGKILPPQLLRIPFFNVHASILPKYRGAAPIQRAIESGEIETGVTIMRVNEELDHGPILAIKKTAIGPDEHAPSLSNRLSKLGADLLLRTLAGDMRETPQDHSRATLAPKIEKSEGEIRWSDSAGAIYNKYRAFDPWPGVFQGELKLIEISPAAGSGVPGEILSIDDGVTVATGNGALRLILLQRAGKSRQRAAEFARGAGWRVGARLE